MCGPETLDFIYPSLVHGKGEQNLGARRLEPIIEFTHEIHIPHNAIHKDGSWSGKEKSQQIEAQKANLSENTENTVLRDEIQDIALAFH